MSTIEKAVTKLNRDNTDRIEKKGQQNADVLHEQELIATKPQIVQEAAASHDHSTHTVQLNLALLEKNNFVSLSKERRLINEEYRVIKRKLINNAFGALSKTL